MSFGDIVTYACLLVAIWYVPRYLLRVYAPGLYARIQNAMHDAVAAAQARDYARYEAKQARRTVNNYIDSAPVVMSRWEDAAPSSSPSSLQTDGVQTPDQTEDTAAKRARLFDTYKPLRKLGMSRDDARAFLSSVGVPLDNNVWAEVGAALEKEAAQYTTPYVGRPTSARFETDADYPYQAPA